MTDTLLGVVLAAGAGRRFGGPKALVESEGIRWVDRAVQTLRAAGVDQVLVISGAWDGPVSDAEVIHNPVWEEGMSTSLKLALQIAAEREVGTIVVTLVDLPDLTAEQVLAVLEHPASLVQASYNGAPGHPVKIGAAHFTPLEQALAGDHGGRVYLVDHGVVDLPLSGGLSDIDEAPLL